MKKKVVDRLGCSSGRRGVGEIKIHPWFNTLNWRRIEAGRDTPPFEPDPHAVYAKVNKYNTLDLFQADPVSGSLLDFLKNSKIFKWLKIENPTKYGVNSAFVLFLYTDLNISLKYVLYSV